jgi:hypothetical protein
MRTIHGEHTLVCRERVSHHDIIDSPDARVTGDFRIQRLGDATTLFGCPAAEACNAFHDLAIALVNQVRRTGGQNAAWHA